MYGGLALTTPTSTTRLPSVTLAIPFWFAIQSTMTSRLLRPTCSVSGLRHCTSSMCSWPDPLHPIWTCVMKIISTHSTGADLNGRRHGLTRRVHSILIQLANEKVHGSGRVVVGWIPGVIPFEKSLCVANSDGLSVE